MHYREEIDAICGKCEKGFSRAGSTALDRGFFCCAECEDAYWSNDPAKPSEVGAFRSESERDGV